MNESQPNVPYGFCYCGCGQKTTISPASVPKYGYVKGKPRHWLPGHHMRRETPTARFLRYVGTPDENGCRIWKGRIAGNGYGRFPLGRSSIPAHRFAYELVHGLVPEGLVLDHLCRNRACVNPDHLEAVTHPENCRRGFAKLAESDVAAIRQALNEGIVQTELARRYGVAQSTISRIGSRLRWRDP